MEKDWLEAFSKMTYGIYLLTSAVGDEINGMIASWASQISYDPPLIMVAIHPNRYSHTMIDQSRRFALHILSGDRKEFLKRFKGPDLKAKFDGIEWRRSEMNIPIIQDCVAWLECDVIERINPGNHTIFIGKVVNAKKISDKTIMSTTDYDGVYIGCS